MGVRLRCQKHIDDDTSTVGVCSSCLRDRLSSLVASRARLNLQSQLLSPTPSDDDDDACESNTSSPPPSLQIPPSVTPNARKRNNRKFKQLFFLNHFFGSKSEKFFDPSVPSLDPRNSDPTSDFLSDSWWCPSPSSSWLNLLRDKCRGGNSRHSTSSIGDSIFPGHRRRTSRVSDRGSSPANCADYDDDAPSVKGCSTPPVGIASRRTRRRATAGSNVSGMSFCFSPLVRASPGGNWKRKGCTTPDIGFSGEIRVSMMRPQPHLSQAASFCANRSRKLADFGKINPSR